MNHQERKLRRQEIADFIRAGGTISEACERFTIVPENIRRACIEFGVVPPSMGRGNFRTYQVLADLLNSDDSLNAIGMRHSISQSAVSAIYQKARKAGIRMKTRGRK